MNATARNVKTLGSNTEGEGSERYTFMDGSWVEILMDKLEILSCP